MSRLIFPDGVAAEIGLLTSVNKKHTADGTTSILEEYLKVHQFDLPQAVLDAATVKTMDISRSLLFKQSSNFTQLRNLEIAPVIAHLKGEVQFLKSIYSNNTKELGNWGITVEDPNKIVYSNNFDTIAATAKTFFTKHLGFAVGKSPLLPYLTQNKIDVTVDKAAIETAIEYNEQAITATTQSENITQLRNILWGPTVTHLKGVGNYLMNFYGNNQKGCGEYGYVVDNSVAKPKIVKTSIKLLDKTTLKGLVIGGTITNEGTEDIHLYKGLTTNGNPIILKPGEKYGIAKGFSAVTVSNPSNLIAAKVSALRTR